MEVHMENKEFFSMIDQRHSTHAYQNDVEISNEEINEILTAAIKAPSAWNLQHWKFVVFKGADAQNRLLPVAYNQQQIVDASCVFAILADKEAFRNVDPVFGPAVEAGYMTQEAKDKLKQNVENAYSTDQIRREQGILNSSLAGMQLILAATAKGWNSCAIGGFNPQAFVKEFNIEDRFFPTMLVTVGKEKVPGHQTARFSVEDSSIWI
jgi:nitroreductase